jgi:pyruvate formate lyase activating enzyme
VSDSCDKAKTLRVGGLQPWSSCDWPEQLVATVFCQGCSWACPYCHNPDLRCAQGDGRIAWSEVLSFLKHRRGLLDGVVISGGEPLLQGLLVEAIADIRSLGFKVGLHTGGSVPERFAAVLPLLSWVGLDIKAAFDEYESITQVPGSGAVAKESLLLLLQSGVPYQLRTTVHPKLLDEAAIARLNADLAAMGCGPTLIQAFRKDGVADASLV